MVLLYCSGALLESLGEPLFNLYNQCFRVDCRLTADAMAITVRSAVAFITVIYYDYGVMGFGLAQLSYGVVHLCVMLRSYKLVEFSSEGSMKDYTLTFTDLLPHIPTRDDSSQSMIDLLFGNEVVSDVTHMTGTSLLKHSLTEADKIALTMSSTATHYDQGVYGVIHNYGSLVARIVFQPIEETTRITFSKMASHARACDDKDATAVVRKEVALMSNMVTVVLKTVGLFSVLFPIFGPFYSRVVVQFGLGARWYSEETVSSLAVYCVYIFTLGLNGVSEAFVYATARPGVLSTVNTSLVVSTVAFCVSAVVLIEKMGTSGILVANIVSMSIRIVFNLVYTHRYFAYPEVYYPSLTKDASECTSEQTTMGPLNPLRDACVHVVDLATMAVVSVVLYCSSSRYAESPMSIRNAGEHVAVGAVCFLLLLGLLYKSHRAEFIKLVAAVRERKEVSSSNDEGPVVKEKKKKE